MFVLETKVVLRDDRPPLAVIALGNVWTVPIAEMLPRKIQCFAGNTHRNTNEIILHITLGDFFFLNFNKLKMILIFDSICGKIHEFIS